MFVSQAQIDQTKVYEGTGPKQGNRFMPYYCPAGKLTIGYGVNLSAGIDKVEADYLLGHRLGLAYLDALVIFPDLELYSVRRKEALVDLMYNMGMTTLLTFKKFIRAVQGKQWEDAARELLDSNYYKQTGQRAKNNVAAIAEG